MARILVVDNYDSFVYNLVQYLYQLGAEYEERWPAYLAALEQAGLSREPKRGR